MKFTVPSLFLLSAGMAVASHHHHQKHVRGTSLSHHHHRPNYRALGRGLKMGPPTQETDGKCDAAHHCDCFTCDQVKPLDNGMLEITIGHCKDGSISWMCCTGVDGETGNCKVTGGGTCLYDADNPENSTPKCETVPEALTIEIPADSEYFTINTHDGQTEGDGHLQTICGGQKDQGGKCAKNGYTAHCLIDFDLEEDCNYIPNETPAPTSPSVVTPSPTASGTPAPSAPSIETPSPTADGSPSPSSPPIETPSPTAGGTPSPTREEHNPPTFITGDPHIKTFSGETYDFHGGCDLILLHNPDFNNGQGLEIHVRTKITRWWSSIESAAVRIGDDILEIKAGIEDRPYWINGKQNKFLTSRNFPFTVGGFSGRYRYLNDMSLQYKIALPDDQAILIKSVKNMLRVELDGAERDYFGKSLGLIGSFDGKFLGRDGATEYEDMNQFGQAWQVRDTDHQLFQTLEGPQYPEKCAMPEVDGSSASRRLGASSISELEAEKACARVAKDEFDNCVSDVLGMDDIAAAEAY